MIVVNPYFHEFAGGGGSGVGPTNLIENSDFTNLRGMTTAHPWFGGVPEYWQTESTQRVFSVLFVEDENRFYANLQTLSETTTPSGPVFRPLYQEVPLQNYRAGYEVTFRIRSLNGNAYFLGAALYAGYNGPLLASHSVSVHPSNGATAFRAEDVAANTPVVIAFWASGGTAPGITDVIVYTI